MHLLTTVLLTLALTPPSLAAKKNPKDSILLSSVKSLTLRANAKTSHRRVSAIPQLTCQGPACKHHTIDVMRCTNQGSDYNSEDIQWSCTASLPEEFKLGSTDVVCEGYENSDDERVLKGSCGVVYRLIFTEKGEERYGGSSWWGGGKGKGKVQVEEEGTDWGGYLFMLLFVGVLGWILYAMWANWEDAPGAAPRRPRRRYGGNWGGGWGGGGGGGGGGWGEPPPPYPGKYESSTAEGWRPGFWTGALGGAAAGYAAGNAANRRQETREVPNSGGGGWFGGGSGAPSRSGSSSSSNTSSARHTSTGFGSTTRR